MNHLSKAKSASSANKSAKSVSSPTSPFTKMNDAPATKSGGKEKTVKIYKFIVDGATICLILTDCYDLKGWGSLEYGAEGSY